MQIELATILGFVSAVLSVAVGAWVALARITIANREKEIDRRLDDCRAESRAMNERLHVEEKATIQQNGEIARLRDMAGNVRDDVGEVRKHMVTKRDWDHLEGALEKLSSQTGGHPRYPSPAASTYRVTNPRQQQEESNSPPRGQKDR